MVLQVTLVCLIAFSFSMPYFQSSLPPRWVGGSRARKRVTGAKETRTPNIQLAKLALYQLSYNPEGMGLNGLEPLTPALSERCSNQLSYRPGLVKESEMCFRDGVATEKQVLESVDS